VTTDPARAGSHAKPFSAGNGQAPPPVRQPNRPPQPTQSYTGLHPGLLQRLELLSPDQCAATQPPDYVIKGLITPGDLVVLVGLPGSGKSAFAPFLGYGVAQGRSVLGRRVRQTSVLYLGCEDGYGMRLRVAALRGRFGVADNFRLCPAPLDLLNMDGDDYAAIRAAVATLRPGLIIVDTLARAFPGLDENRHEGMSVVISVSDDLTRICGSALMYLHHPAKESSGFSRGHGSLDGAADVTMRIDTSKDDGTRTVRLGKNRNGPVDQSFAFSLEIEALGTDRDGDPVSVVIAGPVEAQTVNAALLRAKRRKLSDRNETLFREIENAVAAGLGEVIAPIDGMVQLRALQRTQLRYRLVDAGWFSEAHILGNTRETKMALTNPGYSAELDALKTLKRRGLVGFTRDFVWLI
jgi:KaiC/GvpD/RAD55 family RecA-like ATPase